VTIVPRASLPGSLTGTSKRSSRSDPSKFRAGQGGMGQLRGELIHGYSD
jgi:hypothetical protein